MAEKTRCNWAGTTDLLMIAYHDEEWGVPSHDDRHFFEMLTLEGAQAGLNWRVQPETMLYVNVSQGYKGGSFPTVAMSSSAQATPVPFPVSCTGPEPIAVKLPPPSLRSSWFACP